jgi:hypothetical protein
MDTKDSNTLAGEAAFRAHLQTYGHCDILIDRLSGFPLKEALDGISERLVAGQTLDDPLFATLPDETPLLLRVPESEHDLIEAYLEHAIAEARHPAGQTRAVCAFLFSNVPLATLAGRLTRHLDLRIKTGQHIFFRYFDPRVTHHLPRLLQAHQMAHLLRGIDHWCYAHWRGHLVTLDGDHYRPLPETPAYVRLSIDSTQWSALQGIDVFNLALRTLREDSRPPAADGEALLLNALETARRYRLPTLDDEATLACYLLRDGEDIVRQPAWQEALRLTHSDALPLKDIVEAHALDAPPPNDTRPD